ncbi:MAG TPA: preprotein translocase subunit YajC, partial [Candidatus Microbacterium pullistercoris]|nr:preprotein translocase subunit YajC [Candidatus Microbacterium pullistercoris]
MSPDILLLVLAGALLIFMFWSSSRRRKKMQAEEQERQQSLMPGTPVMTRAGLYGTLVAFDAEDLTKRAVVAIAPGVEVEVHAQTVSIDQETLNAEQADEDADED